MSHELIYTMRSLVSKGNLSFTDHARTRMFERGIGSDDVINFILNGEVIEEYTESTPCPSSLIFGTFKSRACHVVAGLCRDRVKIITVYWPDEGAWLDSRKRRFK